MCQEKQFLGSVSKIMPGCCGVVVSMSDWIAGDAGSIPISMPTKYSTYRFHGRNPGLHGGRENALGRNSLCMAPVKTQDWTTI